MNYKVLITTSGLGQRLGEITKYTNKSLVRVGKKPALSYIIETYPKDVELVITTGYFADQIKQFVGLVYPDRKITLVEIDKYQGEGSSLGYSMLKAKNELQCPFIFHCCDTIVEEPVPPPDFNWNGGIKGESAAAYSSFSMIGDKVHKINDKGAIDFDYLHIGLVGIKDYQEFWLALEQAYCQNPNDGSLNDCRALNIMLDKGAHFVVQEYKQWLDIGNVESLNQARKNIKDSQPTLDKNGEGIFIFEDFVVKFYSDENIVKERYARAKILQGLVPEAEGATKNFYRYKFVKGDLYSRVVNPADFIDFLGWSKEHLWKKVQETDEPTFKKICYKFYHDKTLERIDKFFVANHLSDQKNIINNEEVPPLKELIEKVDFNWLCEAKQYQFHGDYVLDNILKTADSYCLLDWRQNFGGLLTAGDMYYDLAKLNHNLTVNHDLVNAGLFSIKMTDGVVECDIMRKENLVACQERYHKFLAENGYDLPKVKMLTALIWLNMAPLHHHPFNLFLFYFGKLNLWRLINSK